MYQVEIWFLHGQMHHANCNAERPMKNGRTDLLWPVLLCCDSLQPFWNRSSTHSTYLYTSFRSASRGYWYLLEVFSKFVHCCVARSSVSLSTLCSGNHLGFLDPQAPLEQHVRCVCTWWVPGFHAAPNSRVVDKLHCHYWILQLILLSILVLFLHLDLLPPSQTNVCTVVIAGTNDNVVDAAWLVC